MDQYQHLYTLANVEAYGFKLVTWDDFLIATDRPDGLMERALEVTEPAERQFVIYDPSDDDEGWMLIGRRDMVISETVKDLLWREPIEGPLSVEALGF
jgi:hypothetical protein